jgi:hypothetical protein
MLEFVKSAIFRIKKWASTFYGSWLILFLFLFVSFFFGKNLIGNEFVQILGAKAFLDPGSYSNSWFFSTVSKKYIPFYILILPALNFLPLFAVSLLGRALILLFASFSIASIGKKLGLNAISLTLTIALFLWLFKINGSNKNIFIGFNSEMVAYALVLFCAYLLLAKKYIWAAFIAGLSVTMNVATGLWASIAFLLYCIVIYKELGWKFISKILLLWCIGAGYGLYVLILPLLNTATVAIPLNLYKVLESRIESQKLSNLVFPNAMKKLMFVLPFILAVLVHFKRNLSDKVSRSIATLIICFMVPLIMGLLINSFIQQPLLASSEAINVGTLFVILFGLLLIVTTFFRSFSFPAYQWSWFLMFIMVFFVSINNFAEKLHLRLNYPVGIENTGKMLDYKMNYHKTCEWLDSNIDDKAILLTPPITSISLSTLLWSKFSLVAHVDLVPDSKERRLEWYNRLIDFNGGYKINPNALNYLMSAYFSLSQMKCRNLAEKYKANYMISIPRSDLNFHVLYQNEHWAIYEL